MIAQRYLAFKPCNEWTTRCHQDLQRLHLTLPQAYYPIGNLVRLYLSKNNLVHWIYQKKSL